ncbi:alpha/beta hydrolase [Formosa sp. A9]|uniref:alpha/beta hydrolase n=1 Tax=Formosa sp. A9 TaxID=3442641 RepID=UPI003EB86FA2
MKRFHYLLFIICFTSQCLTAYAQTGTKERITIYSKALEGNLIGDPATREVSVYLPPSYQSNPDKKYPVLYFLHGFTDNDSKWFGWENHWINLFDILNRNMTNGKSKDMIVVMPNAYNTFKGSFYGSSETTGDWETFISKELVEYIDSHYRTINTKSSRGLAGHSMGGYGTMRLGMKYPDIFSAIYLLSACCMDVSFIPDPTVMAHNEAITSKSQVDTASFVESINLAFSAAWAPNPKNPPLYLDLPYKNGEIREDILKKYTSNQILYTADQYIYNLKQLKAIGMDAGTDDHEINQSTKRLHELLSNYGIEHQYESYKGDHLNKIEERIETKTLPFFSAHLKFQD